jgi:hypothetical protein
MLGTWTRRSGKLDAMQPVPARVAATRAGATPVRLWSVVKSLNNGSGRGQGRARQDGEQASRGIDIRRKGRCKYGSGQPTGANTGQSSQHIGAWWKNAGQKKSGSVQIGSKACTWRSRQGRGGRGGSGVRHFSNSLQF